MGSSRTCSLLVCLVLSVLPIGAQSTSPTPAPAQVVRDPQAVSALASSLGSMKGSTLLTTNRNQVTVLIKGTYTTYADGVPTSVPLRVEILGLDQIRWEVDEADGAYITIIENGSGWRFGPQTSTVLSLRESVGKQLETLPLLAITDWINSTTVGCRLVGTEAINGHLAQHLSISRIPTWTSDPGEQSKIQQFNLVDFYLDAQTSAPLRLHYNDHPRDWRVNVPVDLNFSNYQQNGGVLMPMTIDRVVMGVTLAEYQFTSVAFNAAISPSDF